MLVRIFDDESMVQKDGAWEVKSGLSIAKAGVLALCVHGVRRSAV